MRVFEECVDSPVPIKGLWTSTNAVSPTLTEEIFIISLSTCIKSPLKNEVIPENSKVVSSKAISSRRSEVIAVDTIGDCITLSIKIIAFVFCFFDVI